MMRIHDNKVYNIDECNLLRDITNPPKHTKHLNTYYSHTLHGCINTRKGKANINNFRILLCSVCSSTIVIVRLVKNINLQKYDVMQCHTQSGNITTNIKVKLDFTLPTLSATNVVTWKCHVDDSSKGRYDMILGRDLLT